MPVLDITANQLRPMIGLRVRHNNVLCEVMDILDDGPTLVLVDLDQHTRIQPDQHGEAHRRVPQTYSIVLFNVEHDQFSPAFLALEPIDE